MTDGRSYPVWGNGHGMNSSPWCRGGGSGVAISGIYCFHPNKNSSGSFYVADRLILPVIQ